MATLIELAEQLLSNKEFAAAEKICTQLKQQGQRGLQLEFLLGSIALFKGDFPAAREIFSSLTTRHPDHSGVLNNLATSTLRSGGEPDDAQTLMERALRADPTNVPALINLGELHLLRKRRDDAQRTYERIRQLDPTHAQGYYGLGLCALAMNDNQKAMAFLEKADQYSPENPEVLSRLLYATLQTRAHEKAIGIARLIVAKPSLKSQLPVAWAVLKRYCLWTEADRLLPEVLGILLREDVDPGQLGPISLEILSSEKIDHATLKAVHLRCGDGLRRNSAGFGKITQHVAFKPGKRMRIGYLSGDFRGHVVAMFILGIINHHDASRFEIFLYSSAPISAQDELTGKFFRVAEHFVDCHAMDDGELSTRMAQDGIHLLVDLSGYTTHTRMSVLTLQPAPVQMIYIGYPGTYGLPEVDYIICNHQLVGTDHESAFVEKAIELPGIYATVTSPDTVTRAAQLPLISNGFITFGSLVNPYKINRSTISLWARVLIALPDSRLYLNHPLYASAVTCRSIEDSFVAEGVDTARLTITDERPPENGPHFLLYDKIDIVLDATPMTGGAGTSDALTVGIPVISRIGSVFHERLSAALIGANVPHPEDYVAATDDEFVAKAVALAGQPQKIASLRQEIRHQVRYGPNSESEQFTRELEDLYRRAWDTKFPEQTIDTLCSWEMETALVTTAEFPLYLSAARNDLYRFVALEKGRWFEDECRFLADHAAQLGAIWDVSDDPGLVTLPIAFRIAENTPISCYRPDRAGKALLEQNVELNGLAAHCHIVDHLNAMLDRPSAIRLAAERNDGHGRLIAELLTMEHGTAPIFLISLHSSSGPDKSAAHALAEKGYSPFILHIGCNVLIPAPDEAERDSFQRNLFYIAADAIPLLEQHNLVCCCPSSPSHIPAATDLSWQAVARSIPLEYPENEKRSEWSDVFLSALNAYALSRNEALSARERLGWFSLADSITKQLVESEATVPRLLTSIRLALDAGQRDRALILARSAAETLENVHGDVLFEPFIAPLPEFAQIPFISDQAVWAQTLCAVTLEKTRSWSSFFTAAGSTLLWKQLRDYPWWQDEADRMLALLSPLWAKESTPQQRLEADVASN